MRLGEPQASMRFALGQLWATRVSNRDHCPSLIEIGLKAGIDLGENGSTFPRPTGQPR